MKNDIEKIMQVYESLKKEKGFTPHAEVKDGKISVSMKENSKELTEAVNGVIKMCHETVTKTYDMCSENVRRELLKTKDGDIEKYLNVLFTDGLNSYRSLLSGRVKIARAKVFYESVSFDKGWTYMGQPVKF